MKHSGPRERAVLIAVILNVLAFPPAFAQTIAALSNIIPPTIPEPVVSVSKVAINGGTGTISSQPAGIDCGTACTAKFDYGTVTLTATSGPGATFGGWTGACTGAEVTCTLNVGAPVAVTATFAGPLPLSSGWNLISLPVQPTDKTPSSVLSGLVGSYDIVWGYLFEDGEWKWKYCDPSYTTGENALTALEAGKGYWIYMTSDGGGTLSVSGSTPDPSFSLSLGWNLVGYNGRSCNAASKALSSLGTSLQVAWSYTDSSWQVYDPNDPSGSTLTQFCPNNGYWIKVNGATTWSGWRE